MNAEYIPLALLGAALFLLLCHFNWFAKVPRRVKVLVSLATLAVYAYWALMAVIGVEIMNSF